MDLKGGLWLEKDNSLLQSTAYFNIREFFPNLHKSKVVKITHQPPFTQQSKNCNLYTQNQWRLTHSLKSVNFYLIKL